MVFGLGGGGAPAGGSAAGAVQMTPQLQAAEAEMDMLTDTFNVLVRSCHAKCISSRYAEPDLNKGESVCLDRCVAKFFLVNKMVGEGLQAMGGGAAAGGASGSFN